jgi:hypothetical protein
MKKYQDGGQIPQEAQNILLDRKEAKEREAFEAAQRAENETPKKAVKEKFNALKELLGIKKTAVKKAKGGRIASASKRADGCAVKGKTRGRMV